LLLLPLHALSLKLLIEYVPLKEAVLDSKVHVQLALS
jgi:hypothetical protein